MPGKTELTIGMNPQFLKAVQNAAKAGVRDTFKAIRTDAQQRSPKDTGENADSIAVKIRSYPGKVSASIFTQSGHGGYLERGTSKMAPQPYIFPAVEAGLNTNLEENVRARLEEFSEGNVTQIPDELIGEAVSKLKSSHAKGVGIIGGKAARKKRELKRLSGR
jgi:HK97 gp10 family phage protein